MAQFDWKMVLLLSFLFSQLLLSPTDLTAKLLHLTLERITNGG